MMFVSVGYFGFVDWTEDMTGEPWIDKIDLSLALKALVKDMDSIIQRERVISIVATMINTIL